MEEAAYTEHETFSKRELFIGLFLVFSVLIIYWQVIGFQFISLDDTLYVSENKQVQQGLTWEGARWAFSLSKQGEVTNWHPLAWLSHMLDCQVFGLNPGMHHLVNVFYHALNALLLFLVLRLMTGSVWRSAFVASLFALHPVNVDSVAWISERKNLLSTTFWLLTMFAYFFYTRKQNMVMYCLVVAAFCLGSLAKSMLITLPFVLLLLDYWPLGRINLPVLRDDRARWYSFYRDAGRLILEKIPLMIISFVVVFITTQSLKLTDQILATQLVPMGLKIKNAIVSYLIYMGKMVWPKDLSIFHPYPDMIPVWQVAGSLAVLLAITILALIKYRKHPYFIVGWLWFLGTLVPVLGIIQAGLWPAIGERWAYIPYAGLFMALAWGVPALLDRIQHKKNILVGCASIILILLACRTWFQLGYWKDDISVFSHSINLDPDNYVAHVNIAATYAGHEISDKAIHHFNEALRIHPNDALALEGLGRLYYNLGQLDKSLRYYSEQVRYYPNDIIANFELGSLYADMGDLDNALRYFTEVIRLDPEYALAYHNLGIIHAKKGDADRAIERFESALKLNPNDAESHYSSGIVLMNQGQVDDAIDHFNEALKIRPDLVGVRNYLKAALNYKKVDERIADLESQREYKPYDPDILNTLAILYSSKGDHDKSLEYLMKMLELRPENADTYYNVSCIYAKSNNQAESVVWLQKAIDKGFDNMELIMTDKDLENIRDTEYFKALVKKNRASGAGD